MNDPVPVPKRRGRKPHHGTALTQAEIQRNYRERRKMERFVDFDLIEKLSRVSLIDNLNAHLSKLEESKEVEDQDDARWAAEKYLGVLMRRFKLKPRK